jgi:DtxR family transcriptional regulator, Mn-dependent transcriptional regulator
MMSLTNRILARLRGLGGSWDESCAAGPPVPEPHRCAALDCESIRLTQLETGQRGVVTCLEEPESRPTIKLAAMGVLPGARLSLVQRYPAWVFRIGYAELALDDELAARVRVIVET